MPKTSSLLFGLFALFLVSPAQAQNTISTFAGGRLPNNVVTASAGIEQPAGVVQDNLGNTYVSSASGVIYKIRGGVLTIFAGTGISNYTGDGGAASNATISVPSQVAVDGSGNVYIADTGNNVIRRVDGITGVITTVAGNGNTGPQLGDNGPATSATLNGPVGVAVDAAGNLYISDSFHNRIRKVDSTAQHIITTLAGNGVCSHTGDNGPAGASTVCLPQALALDGHNNLFVAEAGSSVIRKVDAGTQVITTLAGTGVAGYTGNGGVATSAELSSPEAVSLDGSENLFISDTGNNVIRRVDAATQIISTVAGSGSFGFAGDNGPSLSASLALPLGVSVGAGNVLLIADQFNNRVRELSLSTNTITTMVGDGSLGDGGLATSASLLYPRNPALDAAGNLYFADTQNNLIRRVDVTTHLITTVAGSGLPGFSGDGGPATNASLNSPRAVSLDAHGNVYFSDIGNQRIRRVDATTGVITTVAGNGTPGFSGDGGPAIDASLLDPRGPAVDTAGNLFIPDSDNQRVRRVDAATGIITTVAGSGPAGGGNGSFSGDGSFATSATLNSPLGVDVDPSGNLLIADTGNNRVRRVDATTHVITTVAGNGIPRYTGDGGLATQATLSAPNRVTANGAGNFFISDGGNNVIRRVDGQSTLISTFAGNGIYGFSGDGGPATSANLAAPLGVAVTSLGDLYIGDSSNNRIRLVLLSPAAAFLPSLLSFGNQGVGVTSLPQNVAFMNTGDAPLSISNFAQSGDFAVDHSSCPAILNVGSRCTIVVTFTPTAPGNRPGSFTISDNGLNSPQTLALSGIGVVGGNVVLPQASLSFGSQLIGTSSNAQPVNLFNSGNSPLTIANVAVAGASATEFTQTNNCPSVVAIGGSCTIQVTFTPLAPGSRSATLVITDNQANVPGSQQSVTLSGTGIARPTTPIISVAFNSPNPYFASPFVSGPEAAASATNLLFAAANVWNNLDIPFDVLSTNPSWTNLADSNGSSTSVGVFITGSVVGYDLYIAGLNPDPVRAEYVAFNSATQPGESTSITWQLTGLVPNATYDLCIYGSRADYVRSFSMTIGGLTQNVPTLLFTDPQASGCVYFPSVAANANGVISGVGTGIGNPIGVTNEANWSGFQIVQVPTTGTPSPPIPLTFNPGINVSQVAVLNCPSGTVPCTDPNAHSLKLTVSQVTTPFTLTVTAYEVPLSEANGICENGQTEASDFDCRFVDYFPLQVQGNGNIVVPQCIPYSNGNCVYYRVSNTPPETYYTPGVLEYIAWNNNSYTPPPFYNANNPRLFDDPDDPPYNINHQFVFDITTYYKPTGNYVGVDNGIGGRTLHFNDFVVAYPAAPSYSYALSFVPPLSSTRTAYFEQGDSIAAKFKLSPNTPAGIAMQAPHHVGYSVLLDTNKTGCGDFSGTIEPSATPPNAPVDFTYYTESQFYELRLRGIYPAGQYKMLLSSDLAPEQCAVFVVTKDD